MPDLFREGGIESRIDYITCSVELQMAQNAACKPRSKELQHEKKSVYTQVASEAIAIRPRDTSPPGSGPLSGGRYEREDKLLSSLSEVRCNYSDKTPTEWWLGTFRRQGWTRQCEAPLSYTWRGIEPAARSVHAGAFSGPAKRRTGHGVKRSLRL